MKLTSKMRYVLLSIVLILTGLAVVGTVFAAEKSVTIGDNGSRLAAAHKDGISATYQWMISDTFDVNGTYSNIDGATDKYYDINAEDFNRYIKVSVGGELSDPIGPIGKLVVFDLEKGNVTLGATYSGVNSEGNAVSGTHDGSNIYVIKQSNNGTATKNGITINGNMPDDEYDVTLWGINILNPEHYKESVEPNTSGIGERFEGNINIPTGSNTKHVILRLKGTNSVRNIHYCNKSSEKSSLKITDINGDGQTDGGSLYLPYKMTLEEARDYARTKHAYNHWNSAIGGDDSDGGNAYNMTFAGGYIQAVTSLGDNCTAIGAGGNDAATISITGGHIVAICNGTGTAIGGGIGWNSSGGFATVSISGGEVLAENLANIKWNGKTVGGVAIGGGSSFESAGNTGMVTINISGGTVTAKGTFGNGIGGGNSSTSTGGSATVNITGGTVIASSIGGGNSQKGQAGSATVTVDGDANVSLDGGIGGGDSVESGNGGEAKVTVKGGTLTCGGIIGGGSGAGTNGAGGEATIIVNGGTLTTEKEIGGGNGSGSGKGGDATITIDGGTLQANAIGGGAGGASGNGGDATVIVKGGTLNAAHEIGGGTGGSTSGNGGAADITIEDGVITAGSIGGGPAGNPTGKLGYAKADISGGDISAQFLLAAGGTEACSFTMSGGTLHDVNATTSDYKYHNGAAVYMDDPEGVVEISGGTIEDCRAVNGGAVYMSAGTFTLSGGTIQKCTATQNGGGVYLGGGTMTVTAGKLTQNSAENGGGAYVHAASADDGVFVSGGEINDNTATVNGGGIAVNNGYYKMTGGTVTYNEAEGGSGGGIYVAANGVDVLVEIRSGEVSNNSAGVSGGAVSVVGQEDGTEILQVTVGVHKQHFDGDNPIECDHDYTVGGAVVKPCPEIENNYAAVSGGGFYITGGSQTKLETYCLVENGSSAADGKSKSNFMMVEGGNVIISTAENNDEVEGGSAHGRITINNSIHVFAGDMKIYGSMTNPAILAPISVDITAQIEGGEAVQRGSFNDYRVSAGYYKLTYFENFTDPETGFKTGQYTIYQIKHGDSHEILAALYSHDGYMIHGWWTNPLGDVPGSIEYFVNNEYEFLNVPDNPRYPGDLTLYARWLPVGYDVYFDAGTTDPHRGTMDKVRYDYDAEKNLPANTFFRPGWLFVGWDYDGAGNAEPLADQAKVKNLTTERSITLVAVWEICVHEDALFTYSEAGGDSLVRSCYCEACSQTATLIAENTVYDDHNTTPYEAEVRVVTNVTNGVQPGNWVLTPTYEGKKYNGNAFSDAEFLIGAGRYTVSITAAGKTAAVDFEIEKAQWGLPAEPEYTAEGSTIKIKNPGDTTGATLRYKIVWHDENSDSHNAEAGLADATTTGLTMSTNYTNYYVYVRYDGDDNHYDSEWVRADAVLFYEGNVYIHVTAEQGIDFTTETKLTERGLLINISPLSGYYLYGTKVTKVEDDYDETTIETKTPRAQYEVKNIPKSPESPEEEIHIYVTITGVKKVVVVDAYQTEAEAFGTVSTDTAHITRDSAYTTYFEIQNYDVYTDPKLTFSSALPQYTTIILVDKTAETPVYWSHTVNSTTKEVLLEDFVQMGRSVHGFTAPKSSAETLKYQVIVDFSDSAAGCPGEKLTTTFSAVRSDEAKNNGAPEFPARSLVTNLAATPTSSLVVVAEAKIPLQVDLQIQYQQCAEGVVASKWDGRRGAIVLTFKDNLLPADAHIEVVDQTGLRTTYYRQTDGSFIISLADRDSDTLQISLLSDLFPDEAVTYKFEARMFSSCSLSGLTPVNGTKLGAPIELTFTKNAKEEEVSLRITGDKSVYNAGDQAKINVYVRHSGPTEIPDGTALVLRLLSKDVSNNGLTSNVYIDTGWKQETETKVGDGEENANVVPLGQSLTGSCCIVLEMRDAVGNVLKSVPYYFVISGE